MNHTLVVILGFSIALPAAVAVLRIGKVDHVYIPFLVCIWMGLLNEIINYLLLHVYNRSNLINTDLYCLAEALLYLWLFSNFRLFSNRSRFTVILIFIIIAWLIDTLFISGFGSFDSCFTILYSLVIVFMSITVINRLIVAQVDLLKNPMFLLCIACIIYFSLFALIEIFWLYGLNSSRYFRLHIYRIMTYVNLTVNLVFAFAILWMHRKQEFIPR